MKKLLQIDKPKRNTFIIWDHVIKSAVAFVGTFALMFFGPMFLGGKRRRSGDYENSLSYQLIVYINEHPEVHVGASILAVIVYNIYLVIKNSKSKYISSVSVSESEVILGRTNLYFSKFEEIIVPIQNFQFILEKKVNSSNEKKSIIIFKDINQSKEIGRILPDHFAWEEKLIQIKNMIAELKEFRI